MLPGSVLPRGRLGGARSGPSPFSPIRSVCCERRLLFSIHLVTTPDLPGGEHDHVRVYSGETDPPLLPLPPSVRSCDRAQSGLRRPLPEGLRERCPQDLEPPKSSRAVGREVKSRERILLLESPRVRLSLELLTGILTSQGRACRRTKPADRNAKAGDGENQTKKRFLPSPLVHPCSKAGSIPGFFSQ